MKILVIKDTHGKQSWKYVANTELYDKIIFVGDYMDSLEHTHKECLSNLKDIIYFRLNNPDKVILLLGNHDLHYALYMTEHYKRVKCSGFNSDIAFNAKNVYEEHKNLFLAAYGIDSNGFSYLFTHAGLSQAYWDEKLARVWDNKPRTGENVAKFLNELYQVKYGPLLDVGELRGGNSYYGGPFWAHDSEIINDPLMNMHQIVGHTCKHNIRYEETDKFTSVTIIDTYKKHFLVKTI